LPGKALRELAGLPLIGHSVELARRCPEIERTIVSTDSEEIAAVARELGAEVPFLRPAELARDESPMWPVVRHALESVDPGGGRYAAVLLLQPTSPARLPADVAGAAALLAGRADADGVLGVSEPEFNPLFTGVVERDGRIVRFADARYERRQDVPRVLRITGSLYLWRERFVRATEGDWLAGVLLPWEIPARRAIDIDTAEDLELAELLIRSGTIRLPWLD
jgi:CMP-N,N'-diacetyllegionaminic acid synthase